MFSEIRYAFRRLSKSPGFVVVSLLTLALGIGVNTSMFSVVGTILLQDGPFPHAEAIAQVAVYSHQQRNFSFSEPEIREIRAEAHAFQTLTTLRQAFFALAEPGKPAERVNGFMVTRDMFETFGVQPILGRAFTEEESQPGKNQVVVLSFNFWQTRFNGAKDVLGRTLRLDGEIVTVVGVMPESFDYNPLWIRAKLWQPLNYSKEQFNNRIYRSFSLIGRLKPGASSAQATAELAPIAARMEKDFPKDYSGLRLAALSLHDALIDDVGKNVSWMLLALSFFVLLIACANLANLQIARATAGLRELAIRGALGASRGRLIGQQLIECLLISVTGGVLGIIVALWFNSALEHSILFDGAPGLKLPFDRFVLTATAILSLSTGIFFGIVPAWIASRTDVAQALNQQTRGSTSSRSHNRIRNALIVAEVALGLVLLAGAGLMQRGFSQFMQRPAGWDTARVLTATLPLPESRFDTEARRIEFYRKIEARLRLLPGVQHVALSTSLALWDYTGEQDIISDGQSTDPAARHLSAFHVMITPDYFAAMGIQFIEGRPFPSDLKKGDPQVIIVNETLARHFWPGETALGKRLATVYSDRTEWRQVVGVVKDVQSVTSFKSPSTNFEIYRPLVQEPWSWVYIIARGESPAALADPIRRALAEVDPDLPADQVMTANQFVERQLHNLLVVAKILSGFAFLGVGLAAIGLYGVISAAVNQRIAEFGIRIALGAKAGDVIRLVLKRGIGLTLIGLVLGLAGAYALGRFLAGFLPRIIVSDPSALMEVSVLLFAVAFVACWIPALRATKVDPMTAMRSE